MNEDRMELDKKDLTPNEVSKLAEEVKKLFLEGLKDDEIAEELPLKIDAIRFLRGLQGLRRRIVGNLEHELRVITWDKSYWRVNSFPLGVIQQRLGLEKGKSYGWKVTDVQKKKFTIQIEERQ